MKDSSETTLVLKQNFKASRVALYAAWTNPDQFCKWMGPAADTVCTTEPFDVRVDGEYAFVITSADGTAHGASGMFREVIENERLVFTWTWAHVPDRETLVTVDFRGNDASSSLTLTHEHHVSADTRDNHRGGWTGSFDKLERLINR